MAAPTTASTTPTSMVPMVAPRGVAPLGTVSRHVQLPVGVTIMGAGGLVVLVAPILLAVTTLLLPFGGGGTTVRGVDGGRIPLLVVGRETGAGGRTRFVVVVVVAGVPGVPGAGAGRKGIHVHVVDADPVVVVAAVGAGADGGRTVVVVGFLGAAAGGGTGVSHPRGPHGLLATCCCPFTIAAGVAESRARRDMERNRKELVVTRRGPLSLLLLLFRLIIIVVGCAV
jgi:hypothetical protein